MVTSQVTIYRVITSYTIPSKSMDRPSLHYISRFTLAFISLFFIIEFFNIFRLTYLFFFFQIYCNSNVRKLSFFLSPLILS